MGRWSHISRRLHARAAFSIGARASDKHSDSQSD
jgi:hypothetical protein